MTIPASSAPAAKLFLFNGLTTLYAAEPAVLVCYDPPGEYQPDDIICVGQVVDRQVQVQAMVGSGGQGWLHETYELQIDVSVYRGGDDPRTVFERACSLADGVIQVARADPTLGGAVLVAWPDSTRAESTWEENHKGRLTDIAVGIRCEATI